MAGMLVIDEAAFAQLVAGEEVILRATDHKERVSGTATHGIIATGPSSARDPLNLHWLRTNLN